MKKAAQRVAIWNNLRYRREFDKNLTTTILAEELGELASAQKDVDYVDALMDLMYISLGALWKLGVNPEQVERMFNVVADANDTKTVPSTPRPKNVKASTDKGPYFEGPEKKLQKILDERGTEVVDEIDWDLGGIPT